VRRQGPEKVAFQQVKMYLMVPSGLRAWCRVAAAMLVQPVRRSRVMAVLRREAMAWGVLPVRTWEWDQRALDQHRRRAGDLGWGGHELGQRWFDEWAQQVPATRDGGLRKPRRWRRRRTPVRFSRSSAATTVTELNRPRANGRPFEVQPPRRACTRAVSSVSCSRSSPVIALYRNGSSMVFVVDA
jgi:hypothetical protein